MKSKLEVDGIAHTRLQSIPNDDDLLEIAKNFGDQFLAWEFGTIMRMGFNKNAQNYLFSNEAVPFHWDGAFYKEPRYLLFFCDESHGQGGETLFTDTTKMLFDFDQQELASVTMTFETEKLAHYGGKITVPLLQSHPEKEYRILRFAESVESQKNPVTLFMSGNSEGLYARLKQSAYKHSMAHSWQKGDLLVVDNYRFIHGRKALLNNLERRFRRIQIL